MPSDYNIQSPFGAGLDAMTKVLIDEEISKRQAMIDDVNKRNIESEIKDRETNRKVQEEKLKTESQDRQARITAEQDQHAAKAAKDREDALAKMLTMPPAYMQDITGTEIAKQLPDHMKVAKDGRVLFAGTPEMTVGFDPDFEKALKDQDRAKLYTILTRHGVKFSEVGAKIEDFLKNGNQTEAVFWQDPRTKKMYKYDDRPATEGGTGAATEYKGPIPKGSRIETVPDMRPTQIIGYDPVTGALMPQGAPIASNVKPNIRPVPATVATKEDTARKLEAMVPSILQELDSMKDNFGPLAGRTVQDFLLQGVGSTGDAALDEKLQKLHGDLLNLSTGFASVHGRGVGANVGIAKDLHKQLMNSKFDAGGVTGGIKSIQGFLNTYGKSALGTGNAKPGSEIDVDALIKKYFTTGKPQ